MDIVWSEFAEKQLDKIFNYYLTNIGEPTAKKIVLNILQNTEKLKQAQFIGQKEIFLEHRDVAYRYLISSNYKIIYSVDVANNIVKIADIFDVRQNPIKILRKK